MFEDRPVKTLVSDPADAPCPIVLDGRRILTATSACCPLRMGRSQAVSAQSDSGAREASSWWGLPDTAQPESKWLLFWMSGVWIFLANESPPEPANDADPGVTRPVLHGSRTVLSGCVQDGDGDIEVREGHLFGVTLDHDRVTRQAGWHCRGGAKAARHE